MVLCVVTGNSKLIKSFLLMGSAGVNFKFIHFGFGHAPFLSVVVARRRFIQDKQPNITVSYRRWCVSCRVVRSLK